MPPLWAYLGECQEGENGEGWREEFHKGCSRDGPLLLWYPIPSSAFTTSLWPLLNLLTVGGKFRTSWNPASADVKRVQPDPRSLGKSASCLPEAEAVKRTEPPSGKAFMSRAGRSTLEPLMVPPLLRRSETEQTLWLRGPRPKAQHPSLTSTWVSLPSHTLHFHPHNHGGLWEGKLRPKHTN